MTIGEVADSTGLATSAVRYYDEIGLIAAATRIGGKRRFTPDTVGRVIFVKRCKDAGFSLEEIGLILDDTAGGWHDLVDAKRAELIARRDRLDQVIATLDEIRACGCQVVAECVLQPTIAHGQGQSPDGGVAE